MNGLWHGLPAPRSVGPLARTLPGWAGGIAIFGALAAVLWLERRRPLRARTERETEHEARNLAMAALSAATIRITEAPLAEPLARLVHERRWGLVPSARLPAVVEVAASLVLLDYTLYVWHVLTHRVPFLWRFHRVHHADRDLTATTALRFHFAEMALSVPWRLLQVLCVGAAPLSLSLWQTATLVAILFHHSNVRLPIAIERVLCRWVTTPRMHGIHHSVVAEETGSNWSTIFTWPDYVHGTYRLNVPQAAIRIGAPDADPACDLGLSDLVRMPLARPPRPSELTRSAGARDQRARLQA